jgi:hypothetical protein
VHTDEGDTMVKFADQTETAAGTPAGGRASGAGENVNELIVDAAVATKQKVLLVENEQDAAALRDRGVAAIPLPSQGELQKLAAAMAGGDAAIVLPKRARSREAAHETAKVLDAAGVTTRIVLLKGAVRQVGLAQWLKGDGTPEELEALTAAVRPWQPPRSFRSLAEILTDPSVTALPEVVVPGVAFRGRSTLFAAREKLGKSTFARAMLAAVSSGGEFLGDICRGGTVLLIGLEEHVGDIARSLQEFGADPHRVVIVEPEGVRGQDPIGMIERITEHLEPDLVVIDTLAALTAHLDSVPDAGDAGRWTAIMSRLTGLARVNDAAVVILHHGRRSDGRYRDSSAIGGGVDMILEVQERQDGSRKVTGRGRWPFDDFVYSFDGRSFTIVARSRSIEAQILDFVSRTPGASQRQVEQAVTGKRETVRYAVQKLIEEGALDDRGTGRGRELHRPAPRPAGAPADSVHSTSGRHA